MRDRPPVLPESAEPGAGRRRGRSRGAASHGQVPHQHPRRHAAVHQLSDKGVGTYTIAKIPHLDPKTVRRYAQAATPEDLIVRPRSDTGPLRRYQAYLTHRWNEG